LKFDRKRFVIVWSVLVVLTLSIVLGCVDNQHPIIAGGAFFSAALSLICYLLNYAGLMGSNQLFLQRIMGTMMAKLLLSLAFVLYVVYIHKVNIQSFIVVYFISYFLFTGFEVYALLNNLRPSKKS